MFERFMIMIIGLSLIIGGIHTFFFRTFNSLKYGLVDMGPFHPIIGVIFVVIGLILIFAIVKNILKRKKE